MSLNGDFGIGESYGDRQVSDKSPEVGDIGGGYTEKGDPDKDSGYDHINDFIKRLKEFNFEKKFDKNSNNYILYEPIGVCGLITPWNWPIYQITLKVIPALATGCTMILKPSEIAPMSAIVFAEIIDETGFPPGVFNLINGDGEGV